MYLKHIPFHKALCKLEKKQYCIKNFEYWTLKLWENFIKSDCWNKKMKLLHSNIHTGFFKYSKHWYSEAILETRLIFKEINQQWFGNQEVQLI